MIDRIDIKNFKCFPEATIRLKDINVFTGVNAAGKSTIIQAMLLAFATMKEKNDSVDINNALGIQIGNPNVLVSQNSSDDGNADFSVALFEDDRNIEFLYNIDRMSPLNLPFEINKVGHIKSQLFYLNAERIGPRMSYPAGGENIRQDGANAAYIVEQADMQGICIPKEVCVIDSIKFSEQVQEWMDAILGDVHMSVSTDLTKASTDIMYKNMLVDHPVFPTMTGFGLSYVFSVVVMGLWCSTQDNAILIIENPEAHLHPTAQSKIGKFLQIISSAGVQVIVETHSEHIVDGIRLQAAYMDKTKDVAVDFFSRVDRKVDIQEIWVDSNGELSDWPKDFFDQKSIDLMDLLKMRRRNADKQ